MVFTGDGPGAYFAQLELFLDSLIGIVCTVEKGQLPICGKLDPLFIGDASRLALPAENTGIRIMDHDPPRYSRIIDDILMGYRPHRTDLFAGQAAHAFFLVELGLPSEIGVRRMRHLRKFGSIGAYDQRPDRFF